MVEEGYQFKRRDVRFIRQPRVEDIMLLDYNNIRAG